MRAIYFYKLTNDDGGAPCVQDGLLTLAVCKPKIRVKAQKGDLVIGFAANSLHSDNRLIYVAELDDPIEDGEYFTQRKWKQRRDCIYQKVGSHFKLRKNALYHVAPGNLRHDLGEFPNYARARVLQSTSFEYFGASGTAAYKRNPRLKEAIERLGQGHRVHHSPYLAPALENLAHRILKGRKGVNHGVPSQPPSRCSNHRGGGCGIVKTKQK